MALRFPVQSEEAIERLEGENNCFTARSVAELARDSQRAWEKATEASGGRLESSQRRWC